MVGHYLPNKTKTCYSTFFTPFYTSKHSRARAAGLAASMHAMCSRSGSCPPSWHAVGRRCTSKSGRWQEKWHIDAKIHGAKLAVKIYGVKVFSTSAPRLRSSRRGKLTLAPIALAPSSVTLASIITAPS
jgi:hypothetical protein